ncbi:hypothetical protein C0581_05405 [Candidatus Parcubacteria bacterium]|nr:MAG: hypothetical protein C0581_05405 [Candidatus Parcubacteria bacterium]
MITYQYNLYMRKAVDARNIMPDFEQTDSPESLDMLRGEIDEVDREMIGLLKKKFVSVDDISRLQAEQNIDILNEIDKNFLELFQRRSEIVHKIGLLKKQQGLDILDEGREEVLRKKHDAWAQEYGLDLEHVRQFFQEIMRRAKEAQSLL